MMTRCVASETAAVKCRPIMFDAESVKAILEGRKTQTRGPVPNSWWRCLDPESEQDRATALTQCPYGVVGDQLWVKEPLRQRRDGVLIYEHDGEPVRIDLIPDGFIPARGYCSAIHMPRWASRITLEITDVRVQRLEEITPRDVVAEGCGRWIESRGAFVRDDGDPVESFMLPFFERWDKLNAKRGYPWLSNPWVWAKTFKCIKPQPAHAKAVRA